MTTVGEIKEQLINLGIGEPSLEGKKKAELQSLLDSLTVKTEDDSEGYSIKDLEEKDFDKISEYGDEDWDMFVMSKFKRSEMVDGNPNVIGLRRISEMLLGPIIDSGPTMIGSNLNASLEVGRAHSIYSVTFQWRATEGVNQRTFRAAADSFVGNTDKKFSIYPVAMADTRAEARALKRALLIESVCSDELTENDAEMIVNHTIKKAYSDLQETTAEFDENSPISDKQINFIKKKCDILGIDEQKFISSGKKAYNNIEKVNTQTAASMIEQLNKFQRDQSMISENIKKG